MSQMSLYGLPPIYCRSGAALWICSVTYSSRVGRRSSLLRIATIPRGRGLFYIERSIKSKIHLWRHLDISIRHNEEWASPKIKIEASDQIKRVSITTKRSYRTINLLLLLRDYRSYRTITPLNAAAKIRGFAANSFNGMRRRSVRWNESTQSAMPCSFVWIMPVKKSIIAEATRALNIMGNQFQSALHLSVSISIQF